MLASKLIDNISSDFLAALNAILPKTADKRILVFVESYEDISFWRHILSEYEKGGIEFDIQAPSHKGKTGALERSNDLLSMKVGEYLIICVDSDYDFLLPEHSDNSKLINNNPYIFQTYSYSIENLHCFSESLHAVCVQSTKQDRKVINFYELLKLLSGIIYKLLIWNLYFRKNNDHTSFTITDFCKIIKLIDQVDVTDQCKVAIAALKSRVDTKVLSFEIAYPLAKDEIDQLAKDLKIIGLNEENAYLFIQGHTLKDNIVLMILKPVCQLLAHDEFKAIKNRGLHKEQEENERNQYNNQKLKDVSLALNSNFRFQSCFLYKKIKADFDNYIVTIK